jgi:hypothetical protein
MNTSKHKKLQKTFARASFHTQENYTRHYSISDCRQYYHYVGGENGVNCMLGVGAWISLISSRGHVGGGLEYRFTPHIGIFGEVG